MARMPICGLAAFAVVLASTAADARSVPAYPLGHPLDPTQWNCFGETYGGVRTISTPGVCNSTLVGWEIGLPADSAGGKSATVGFNDPSGGGTHCQLLASQDAFNFVAWSNVVYSNTVVLSTSSPMVLNNSGLPAGGSLYMACFLPTHQPTAVTVVNYNQ